MIRLLVGSVLSVTNKLYGSGSENGVREKDAGLPGI